jgi:hypothetical protein
MITLAMPLIIEYEIFEMSRPKYINSTKAEGRRWSEDPIETEEKTYPNDRLWRFLKNVRCEDCYKKLRENRINFEDLKYLKENDVLELGFPIGLRNRLLNALDPQEEEDVSLRLKDIFSMVSEIVQKQAVIVEGIKKCQDEIAELQYDLDGEGLRRRSRDTFSATSPKFDRVRKPTISSIAKQNVIPNKYMQVSPLRASYYSRLMN